MKLTRSLIIGGLLALANVALGVWGYIYLPAATTFPINYGVDGQPHALLGKAEGLQIMPEVAIGILVLLALIPRLPGRRAGPIASADAYGLLMTSLMALFLVAEAALITHAIDPSFDVLRWVFLAGAVVLVLVGNTLGKVRHNDFFGVRTPWTLADARVWDKTHRFTGRVMVLAAAAFAAASFVIADHALLIIAFILAAAGPGIVGAVYSWTLRGEARSA
jgi:uncharacterized membrane protein